MESIRFVCPHCGLKMEATLEGKPSLMMVFVCARCKEPLMRFDGEVFELDREEFVNLRRKLNPVIGKLLEEANSDRANLVKTEEAQVKASENTEKEQIIDSEKPTVRPLINDDFMQALAMNLECSDVSEFIDKM